jgi:hypothetical protein
MALQQLQSELQLVLLQAHPQVRLHHWQREERHPVGLL